MHAFFRRLVAPTALSAVMFVAACYVQSGTQNPPDTVVPAPPPPPERPTQPDPIQDEALPVQAEVCSASGQCSAGLSCVKYYGVAGPQGPQFTSCEIPCAANASACPSGQACMNMPDGPGMVCRPVPAALPAQAQACTPNGQCAAGLSCMKYYGIAGPRGPEFSSCEIACGANSKGCPLGQSCVTISDGPGAVCRPRAQ